MRPSSRKLEKAHRQHSQCIVACGTSVHFLSLSWDFAKVLFCFSRDESNMMYLFDTFRYAGTVLRRTSRGERRSRCAVYPSDAEGFMRALSSAGAALNPSQGAGSPVSDRKVARASFQSRLRTTPTHGYSMRGTSQTEPHRAIGKVRNKLVLSRTDHQIVQKRLLSQRLG